MEAKNIFTSLAFFIFIIFITKLLTTKRNKKNNLPPSPPNSLPILGHLHLLKKPLHQSLAHLSARHGPILLIRFGIRRVLVVSSAPLVEECFTTNDLSFANRPKLPSARANSYNYSTIGTACYGPLWRDMRRIANTEFLSGHRLSYFSYVRADEAKALARQLFLDSIDGGFTRVTLRPRLFGLTMNVIMKMMVGKRYYGEESGDDEARRFKEIVEEGFVLAGASNIGDFLPPVVGFFARRRVRNRIAQILGYKDMFFQDIIEKRRTKIKEEEDEEEEEEKEKNYKTMLDAMLSLQRIYPEQYTDHYIKALIQVSLN